jgi:copper chaperone CopZ
MDRRYRISGLTCANCEAKVKSALLTLPFISTAEVSKENGFATITMDQEIPLGELQDAISNKGNYRITEPEAVERMEPVAWVKTYKPILLVFGYLVLIAALVQYQQSEFDVMKWMNYFMAGFFLVFSFFKLLDIKGFAESYRMYDVVAKYIPVWAVIYPFVELGLGLAYLISWNPLITNLITLFVMTFSIVGVIKSVLSKSTIRCACLGAVFNLPMTTVTIIEDGLMIFMSAVMLFLNI